MRSSEYNLKKAEAISVSDIFENNKQLVYSVLIYLAGVIIGSFYFKTISDDSSLNKAFSALFAASDYSFTTVLLSKVILYSFVFLTVVFLSMSIYGFALVNFTELLCGLGTAIKISFYYSQSVAGIGYAALVSIPQCALFVTVLLFLIKSAGELSREVYCLAIKKTDTALYNSPAQYLKMYLVFYLVMLLVALINSASVFALSKVIHY